VDSETDEGVPGAIVRVYWVGDPEFRLFLDLQAPVGKDLAVPLPEGSLDGWVIDIRAPGYACHQRKLDGFVDGEDSPSHEIRLDKARCFTGRVLDPKGQPAPGVAIDVTHGMDCWTDADGNYSFPVPDEEDRRDTLEFEAWKADLGRATLEFRISEITNLALPDLMLMQHSVLRGRLLLEDGSPVRGFKVLVNHVDHEPWDEDVTGRVEAIGRTDAHGCFVFKGLVEGRYELGVAPADLQGRALKSVDWVDLAPHLVTGRSRTWRFQRLDLVVRFPEKSGDKQVCIEAHLPGEAHDMVLISWEPSSALDQRSLALPVRTKLEVLAELPGRTWALGRITMQPGMARRSLSLVVPGFDTWVPVILHVQDRSLMREKTARVAVELPNQPLDPCLTTESSPGVFHFRLPPGKQRLRMWLEDRRGSRGCNPAAPGALERHEKPEFVPFEAWLSEERVLYVTRGKKLRMEWRPGPAAGLAFLFEAKGSSKGLPHIYSVRVDHLDPLDPSGQHPLAWIRPMGVRWGRAERWSPELAPGHHVFCFRVMGFEPVVRAAWLAEKQERLVRVQLQPQVSRPGVPELIEPYRCGRAQRHGR